MKGSEEKLLIFMDGSKKRFVIPVYQRNYDWKMEHCKQLFDDLIKIIKQNRKSHFFGSIVSVFNPEGAELEFLIIDGQQRLTTVSLILLAMYKLIENGFVTPKSPHLGQQIYEDYLVDKWETESTRIKLKSIKNDQIAFEKLFDSHDEFILNSNLTINYKYFYDRIQKEEIGIDELYQAIFKLEVINIILNEEDNPQLIFESLNSTGLDLSEGDKIRNYILMGLPSKKQEELYGIYWNKIEEQTEYDVSSFIRDYLSIKQQSTPAIRNVYVKFKEYVEETNIFDIETLLKDLVEYSKKYQHLIKANSSSKILNECIYRLNRIKTTITRPFFMEVLNMKEQNLLSQEDVNEIFLIVENYIFRRSICDLPTNALNKIFLLLNKEIIRFDGTYNDYLEKFKFALLSKRESGRFPDDEEFSEALSEKNIYAMRGENKLYLFERLENYKTLETKDVWGHFDNGTYSVEHIMPQKLTGDWIERLGEDYERIHSVWLHRLANLTITAYNSKYSNKPFQEKRDMENGFIKSGLRLNQWIGNKNKWTESEIEERNGMLQLKSFEIWPYIESNFIPPKKQLENVSLDDEILLTGRAISGFTLLGIEEKLNSWADMYHHVLIQLHKKDMSILTKLAISEDPSMDLSLHFSNKADSFLSKRKIDNDIYVWTGTDTQYKVNVLKKILPMFDVEPSELVFYLKGDTEDTINTPSRFIIRRKYWSYSLPNIREKTKKFHNVNPSNENWINGYIGINGLYISCVANFDSARTELNLSMPQKDKNKELFDYLYSNKNRLENKVGESLIWERKDDTNISKIYFKLTGVNVTNKDDWPEMSNFHAEKSKLLIEGFEEILKQYFFDE